MKVGKHVAIIFKDLDHYYDYVSMFLPEEGEFGISSGMYINNGYGHFVFPTQDMEYAEPIAVHELTHACLSHLPIPTWLNEGLAVLMEEVLANNTLYIDKEIVAQHHQYWNEENIQEFWSGDSFYASDEGQGLSYRIQEPAVYPLTPTGLRFLHFFMLGPVAGLLLAIGLIVVYIQLDPRIRFPYQLSKIAPVLTIIPQSTASLRQGRKSKVMWLNMAGIVAVILVAYIGLAFLHRFGWVL